ncbi:hypothetical protein LR021_01205 [Candidatus Bipolaricaulota bacterium]|nr:hypothetical protein [Candidatus Bipolaricaulota bacterium]
MGFGFWVKKYNENDAGDIGLWALILDPRASILAPRTFLYLVIPATHTVRWSCKLTT